MPTPSLILISSRDEDQKFAGEVAVGAGLSLKACSSPKEGVRLIEEEAPQLVFVDASGEKEYLSFEQAVHETIGLFSDKLNPNHLHFIYSGNLSRSQYLVKSPLFGNAFDRSYGDFKYPGALFAKLVKAQIKNDVFGLQSILGKEAKIQSIRFQRTGQKQDAVDAVRSLAAQLKFQGRAASTIANAVDEVIMNAMFDAPVDATGKRLYSATLRSTDMPLPVDKGVVLQVGYDGVYFAIAVSDQYGSIDKTTLMDHLSRSYADEDYKVKHATASAGLGLATLFSSGGSLHVACESGARSEVTLFYRRTESYREFKNQFQFLSTQFYI